MKKYSITILGVCFSIFLGVSSLSAFQGSGTSNKITWNCPSGDSYTCYTVTLTDGSSRPEPKGEGEATITIESVEID